MGRLRKKTGWKTLQNDYHSLIIIIIDYYLVILVLVLFCFKMQISKKYKQEKLNKFNAFTKKMLNRRKMN
jgi:hypothetical protein